MILINLQSLDELLFETHIRSKIHKTHSTLAFVLIIL